MKNLLIATVMVGAAVAGLLLYLREQNAAGEGIESRVADAVGDAYDTMNKHIGQAERKFDHALN